MASKGRQGVVKTCMCHDVAAVGGEWKECDGTMFGNRWLPNIAIINNQHLNY